MGENDVPTPLCAASSGAPIVLCANDATRRNGISLTTSWGQGVAVSDGPVAGLIEFQVATEPGAYELWVEFASAESRPMQIALDGLPIMHGLSGITGGWCLADQAWQRQTSLVLKQGRHVIQLTRDGSIPHLRRIALLPVMEGAAPEIARIAAERRVSARAMALEAPEVEDVIATVTPLLRRLFNRRRSPQRVMWLLAELAGAVANDVSYPQERVGFFGPFNGQKRRQEIFNRLDAILAFDVLIETGAYIGTTTEMLAGLGRPVYSCELNPSCFLRSAVRLSELKNVKLYNKDSRIFLKELFEQESGWNMPFFYLDAHFGGADLPLAEEISLIVSTFSEFVICVDDFKHPDPGYGYDRYSDDMELSLEWLRPRLSVPTMLTFLYPAASANSETGARRGTLFIVPETLYRSVLQGEPLLMRA
jgi:hypothetical protein